MARAGLPGLDPKADDPAQGRDTLVAARDGSAFVLTVSSSTSMCRATRRFLWQVFQAC
jgi:hypothetical protein